MRGAANRPPLAVLAYGPGALSYGLPDSTTALLRGRSRRKGRAGCLRSRHIRRDSQLGFPVVVVRNGKVCLGQRLCQRPEASGLIGKCKCVVTDRLAASCQRAGAKGRESGPSRRAAGTISVLG